MTPFQKEMLFASFENEEVKDFASQIIFALDNNVIEAESLSIPVFNLELERFIPCGYASELVKSVNLQPLMRSSIVFDLYIPSKRCIVNFETMKDSCLHGVEYRDDTILKSVRATLETIYRISALDDIGFVTENNVSISLTSILKYAVSFYLKRQGIDTPSDSLRDKLCKYGMTQAIDSFIYTIKK